MIARRLIVRGRVQGVFYRNWAVETAQGLGITGWVRNLLTGEVEILACGEADAVEAMIARCRLGPSAASVSGIDIEEAAPEPLASFGKRPMI